MARSVRLSHIKLDGCLLLPSPLRGGSALPARSPRPFSSDKSQGSIMPKQIRLNAFAMNCVAHQSPGLWTHPRDRTAEYNRLPYWIDLAKTLERGRFDGLFLADVLGVYDVFGGSPDAAIRNATQTPANEPLMLIPAVAAVTKHLGFGVTSNLSFEP